MSSNLDTTQLKIVLASSLPESAKAVCFLIITEEHSLYYKMKLIIQMRRIKLKMVSKIYE